MNKQILKIIKDKTGFRLEAIEAVIKLFAEDATIPFIARYRKEVTGGLDEEQIHLIQELQDTETKIFERRNAVLNILKEKEKLTPELEKELNEAQTLQEIENIYLPYKEKRKTKASIAIANGLQPLADLIFQGQEFDYLSEAQKYLNENVTTVEIAINQALDILAEKIAYTPRIREISKNIILKTATIKSKLKKNVIDENNNFEIYYDFSQAISTIQNHRLLAINRGVNKNILFFEFAYDDLLIIENIESIVITHPQTNCSLLLKQMIKDSFKRLISPSIENEIFNELYDKAEKEAINLFCLNLEQLLSTPPFKNKAILGFDPSFRTGCKLAVIDEFGNLKDKNVIFPNQKYKDEEVPTYRINEAENILTNLVNKYNVSLIAIGNGTASRESEAFVSNTIKKYQLKTQYLIVSEIGASVYSASKNAIKEFPNLHVEERSAISIARRVIDPLSELIKIDPKSIGVGQYQHDVNQKELKEKLDFTTSKIVNRIGVNINTAGVELLSYVSGLSSKIAQNIIDFREDNPLKNRIDVKKIKGITPKNYQQAIGFLKILDSSNPLDKTFIHPDNYETVTTIINDLGGNLNEITNEFIKKLETLNYKKYGLDEYTFSDIKKEITQPLYDYRDNFATPILKSNILHAEDLLPNMKLEGTVRSIVDFGVFVDIGLKNNGFIHLSKLSKRFIKHPLEVLKVGDIVEVYVINYDSLKNRISLSLLPLN
ncbi:MAG: RNA-binding transcriptional accessory protein [Bacillales bacterium]|jgi:uncharacterized protein|nr:RNA-binding transcriptional accessory protein [Bacillales bacterium]